MLDSEMQIATSVSVPLVLDSSYGAMSIGFLVTAILFGVTILQVVNYIQTHWKHDRVMYRVAVCWLCSLDAARLVFISHMMYHYLIRNFGNPAELSFVVWSFKAQILIGVPVITSVHWLYIYRLSVLSKGSKYIFLCLQIVILSLGLGLGIVQCYFLFLSPLYADIRKLQWMTITVLSVIASSDFLVAAAMCYLLAKSRTGFPKTNNIIKKVTLYVCGSGCLTSFCSMTAIIMCVVMPNNFIYLAVELPLIELYVNSFIALLNARSITEPLEDRPLSTFRVTSQLVRRGLDEDDQAKYDSEVPAKNSQQVLHISVSNRDNTESSPPEVPHFTFQGPLLRENIPVSILVP